MAIAVTLAAIPGDAVPAEGRVALLIGNAAYANPKLNLRNPANDATALAEALDGLGFDTRALINADREEAEVALAGFARKAEGAEIALFFFAGHGMQIEGENYLIGSGFSILSRGDIAGEALSLDVVRAALARAQPELGLIVLDACRDNPFRLPARGLARAQGGAGLLIAYATDPGNVAYDGRAANSVFTSALIRHIATPGLDVRLMFGRVRQDVVRTSTGGKVPWVEEAVLGEHVLRVAPAGGEPAAASAVKEEVRAWQMAAAEGSAAAYHRYLDRYPAGLFQALAAEGLRSTPAAGTPPVPAPSGAGRDDLAAALVTLGFLEPRRDVRQDEIDKAYGEYVGRYGPAADLDGLYLDAAQVAVLVGAATAREVRTDMGKLAAIEAALGAAERARDELQALAEASAAARAVLGAADADIAAMHADREHVLERLDASRSLYADLVERASQHFRPYLSRALPGLIEGARGGALPAGPLARQAEQFVRHATADGVARAAGSYAWLADFLPQD